MFLLVLSAWTPFLGVAGEGSSAEAQFDALIFIFPIFQILYCTGVWLWTSFKENLIKMLSVSPELNSNSECATKALNMTKIIWDDQAISRIILIYL